MALDDPISSVSELTSDFLVHVVDDPSGVPSEKLIPGSGISGIRVEDEGVSTVATATALNFVGSAVTVTDAGSGEATVTITGGSSITMPKGAKNTGGGSFKGVPGWVFGGEVASCSALWQHDLCLFPIWSPHDITISAISIYINSGQTPATVVRFGIYPASQSDPLTPSGNLIADWGTVPSTASGAQTLSGLSQALTGGSFYLIALATSAATLVLNGPLAMSALRYIDVTQGSNTVYLGRTYYDYNAGTSCATALPTTPSGNFQGFAGGATARYFPFDLTWT